MDGSRAALETIPRQASYVFAPADPLLIEYARTWALSEPYLIRLRDAPSPEGTSPGGQGATLPLQALADNAGAMIAMGGPQLPGFLRRSA
jgi:hypothetical protein